MSPDGKSVYVASYFSDAVAIFDRDTTTGALTQKPGTAGCILESGSGDDCQDGVALDGARGVAVSADGKSVYVGSAELSDAVAIFDRDTTTGALAQKPGIAACVSEGCERAQTVKLQRRRKASRPFKTFARDTTNDAGSYALKRKLRRSYTYRARVAESVACAREVARRQGPGEEGQIADRAR